MQNLWTLFFIFFKIGAFTFGGGYAMLPLMEREMVTRRGWISPKEFLDLVAIAQSAPGILAVNMAIFVGYKLRGTRGAFVCMLGAALPSFIIILILVMFFARFEENPTVARIFKGIRPAVVALIAVPVFQLGRAACKSWVWWWIPVAVALAVWGLSLSPVYVVLLAAVGGLLYGRLTGDKV